ncbi:ribosome-associated translation inhibitor RaiA [Candidatus Uhrbacteria bacterium]|nr:ribosome-associated translation inhibitor RaiA [Candidatus Uhrbacteria bacterium]
MRITEIIGTNMEVTEAIRAYVEQKLQSLEKFCERYNPCDVSADVGKTSEHHNKGKIFRAEFTMSIPGTTLRAESVEEDLYAAIDVAKDDLKRQLIERKERMTERPAND